MIQKVSLYFILPMCIIAFFLALVGVTKIELGNDYYNFIQSVSLRMSRFNFKIPNIPTINKIGNQGYSKVYELITLLIAIGNFFVSVVNVLIKVLNILIMIINVIIELVEFIIALIIEVRNFINHHRMNISYV